MQAGSLSIEPYLTISPRQLQVLQPQKCEEVPEVTCPRGFCQEEREQKGGAGEGRKETRFVEQAVPRDTEQPTLEWEAGIVPILEKGKSSQSSIGLFQLTTLPGRLVGLCWSPLGTALPDSVGGLQ